MHILNITILEYIVLIIKKIRQKNISSYIIQFFDYFLIKGIDKLLFFFSIESYDSK